MMTEIFQSIYISEESRNKFEHRDAAKASVPIEDDSSEL